MEKEGGTNPLVAMGDVYLDTAIHSVVDKYAMKSPYGLTAKLAMEASNKVDSYARKLSGVPEEDIRPSGTRTLLNTAMYTNPITGPGYFLYTANKPRIDNLIEKGKEKFNIGDELTPPPVTDVKEENPTLTTGSSEKLKKLPRWLLAAVLVAVVLILFIGVNIFVSRVSKSDAFVSTVEVEPSRVTLGAKCNGIRSTPTARFASIA